MLSTFAPLLLALLVGLFLTTSRGDRRVGPGSHHPGRGHALVVTGSYGAGHDRAAEQVAAALRRTGLSVEVVDVVDHYPWGTGPILRRAYFAQLNACPASWGWTLCLLSGHGTASRLLLLPVRRALGLLPARSLRTRIRPQTQLVVSTHPFASAGLARLRRSGALAAPVVTYLTDASVHPLWVHDGIDAHVAIYAEAARQARALHASGVRLVRPLVPDCSAVDAGRRGDLLAAAAVPAHRPVAFVVGGSEGVGDLLASARDVARTGLLTPVVVCGRNTALLEALTAEPGVVALGWVDGLRELLAAGDVVVENGGGFTVLESLAAGVPVVSYRSLPGHGATNARALAADGLATYAEDEHALAAALVEALRRPRTVPPAWSLREELTRALDLVAPAAEPELAIA